MSEPHLSAESVGFFSCVTGNRTQRKTLKFCYGRLRLDIRKNFFLRKEWSNIGMDCPGEWWSLHPWRYPRDVDVALRDIHELVMALDR